MINIIKNQNFLFLKISVVIVVFFLIVFLIISVIFRPTILGFKVVSDSNVNEFSRSLRFHSSLYKQDKSPTKIYNKEDKIYLQLISRIIGVSQPESYDFIDNYKYLEINLLEHRVLIFFDKLSEREVSNFKKYMKFFFYYDLSRLNKYSFNVCNQKWNLKSNSLQHTLKICNIMSDRIIDKFRNTKIIELRIYDNFNFSKLTTLYFEYLIVKFYLYIILILIVYVSFFYYKKIYS